MSGTGATGAAAGAGSGAGAGAAVGAGVTTASACRKLDAHDLPDDRLAVGRLLGALREPHLEVVMARGDVERLEQRREADADAVEGHLRARRRGHVDVRRLRRQVGDVALGAGAIAVVLRGGADLLEVPEGVDQVAALLLGQRQVPQDVGLLQHRVRLGEGDARGLEVAGLHAAQALLEARLRVAHGLVVGPRRGGRRQHQRPGSVSAESGVIVRMEAARRISSRSSSWRCPERWAFLTRVVRTGQPVRGFGRGRIQGERKVTGGGGPRRGRSGRRSCRWRGARRRGAGRGCRPRRRRQGSRAGARGAGGG